MHVLMRENLLMSLMVVAFEAASEFHAVLVWNIGLTL
jgi:hypothetical protein